MNSLESKGGMCYIVNAEGRNMKAGYRVSEVIFALENAITKGRYGSFKRPRKSDCFVYVLEGMTKYYFKEKVFTVKKGQVLYLAKNSEYEMEILTERYEFIFVDFYFFDRVPEMRISDVYSVRHKGIVEGLFRQLLNLWIARGKNAELECISLLYGIYAKVIYGMGGYTPESKAEKIRKACEYILNHYSEELDSGSFGKMCGMTETHFRRLFKEIYGMSPIKYINEIRTERARGLIANSNLSLSRIAEKVGYGDVYYFSRVFKKIVGISPSVYKKICAGVDKS